MILRAATLLLMTGLVGVSAAAQVSVSVDGVSTLTLTTAAQGRAILGRSDTFSQTISGWDRAARMGKDGEAREAELLKFAADQALDWSDAERVADMDALTSVATMLKPYARWLPPEVLIIKSTGREGHGGAYTRQNAVIFQSRNGRARIAPGVLAHELWHVISRHHPELRDKMYAVIGFAPCGPLEWPAAMDRLRVTNPDAPINQHWIWVTYQGKAYHAMPVITARDETFGRGGRGAGGSLNFLDSRLLMVEKAPDGKGVVPIMKDGQPLRAAPDEVQGFFEQVGRNTNYLIHPEETIADNFSYLVVGRQGLPSPEIVERLKAVLVETDSKATAR